MKKTYIAPTLLIAIIHTEHLISQSLRVGTTAINNEEDVLVKGNSSSGNNSWFEDWSY